MNFLLQLMLMGQTCPGGAECIPIHPPCDLGVVLQTHTLASWPGDLTRVKLGVGEKTNLTVFPTPSAGCSIIWQVSGGGSLSVLTGASTTFTAHYRASTSIVTVYVGDVPFSVVYNVVEPSSLMAVPFGQPFAYPAGVQGAGTDLTITMHPTDVSFAHLEVCELPSPGVNVLGYFLNFPPSDYDHETAPCWSAVFPQNEFGDTIELSFWPRIGNPPQWSFGGFDWDIPVRWQVEDSPASEKSMPANVLQRFRILDSSGTTLVTKLGASVWA